MSVANDSSGTPSKILIDKDLQSTAQEKEAADEVPSQFKSPAEIRGYPKATQTRMSRKLNGTSSSSSGRLIQMDPNVVPPRKRILRELERVSLEDQASKRHQYGTIKRRQQGSSKIFTDSLEKKNLVEKKKKQEEMENKTRKRKPKKTVIMASKRKRSKFWNYFENLEPSLVKCTTCKKKIKVGHPTNCITIMRAHLLKKHGMSFDDDTLTLPDDLKQYYSELPGYKAKCNNCGKTLSFLTNTGHLRSHLRRHSTRILSRDETVIMASKRKRSKFWNYFEDLEPSLVKCTTCKKKIKVPPTNCITIMRAHLLKKHGMSFDDDTLTLPDDLKQYYSELPGYKAKCNNCGKTLSFLTNTAHLRRHLKRHSTSIQGLDNDTLSLPDDLKQNYSELPGYKAKCNNCGKTLSFLTNTAHLRRHLKRHSTIIQSRDETVIMASKRKRSNFWNYFEELKPTLIKCTTCKKEIKVSHPSRYTKIMRMHLSRHGIFLNNDTLSLPDDLKQNYSELPGYKAKCNNCGQTVSFLTNTGHLRRHLRRHSTIRIQSRDETVIMAPKRKRSNFWNYFEELKPTLIKCTTCKKEIKVPHPSRCTKVMRMHLSRHGIFLNNDTLSLPDDLKQYYSELPGYKAKCNNCGKTLSFLTNTAHLRSHLRRHSTSIQGLDNDTLSLPDDLKQNYSELPGYKAKCNNCGKAISFLTNIAHLRRHLKRHSTIIQSRDETVIMAPKRKRSNFWNYFEELKPTLIKCTTCKKEIKVSHPSRYTKVMRMHLSRHGIFLNNDTLSLPDDLKENYSELPGYKAKCNNCGKTVSFLTNTGHLRRHLRRHSTSIQGLDNDTLSLPDDLKQNYSKLPGYKAKCNNCGKAISFLSNIAHLRKHLKRHSTIIQSRDETVIMAPKRKRSNFWNYFEELKPTLIKCTTCKKEIKVSHPSRYTKVMRMHLSRHGIFLNNDTLSLPDDLKQNYSELPGYKAKCNNCGETVSFLTNTGHLRRHLRRHSTIRIQSRDETVIMASKRKRSKFWNYFEDLEPSLVKCTTCKKKIKVYPTKCITIMRAHLFKKHGMSFDDDTLTLPDDLKQYYSELPGYKAKCNNCGETLSFLSDFRTLRIHLRRHSTRILSRDETVIMAPKRKRSKFWNYFEKLKPMLIKCTTCKKEIKVSHPSIYTKVMRMHLSRHGIFLDDDTLSLPDDLKQYYSQLPGYKAKCNNCGETLSFLSDFRTLRIHLRRHSTRILSRDETVIMARKRKRSNFWNYFEELKPTLIKCTTCKKEIKVSHPSRCIKVMRMHLSRHGIFLNNDTLSLPDDLKQNYSELPGYKAKCNNCGETVSFLTNTGHLRKHLRRHSTIRIQSRDETVIMASKRKRSKFWNYFEDLEPSLVKCTTCKKKIKVHPTKCITIMRAHLLKKHGMSFDDDTLTLPDDLKQYYSELPGYKAKCNNCGKTYSFLSDFRTLQIHLRRHSTKILSRDETVIMAPKRKRSKLWNYFEELKPTLVKCTICKKEIKISSLSTRRIKIIRAHLLKKHGISPDDDTLLHDDLKQYYSQLPGYKAKCNNCGKAVSFLTRISYLRVHLRRHSTITQSRDEPSISSLADDNVGPSARRQGQDTSGLLVQSFIKETTEKTGALNESSTSSLVDYMDPSAKRQCGELSSLPVQSFRETIEKTGALNEPGTSISTDYNTNSTAECQSQETVDLDPQTCKQSKKDTRACDGPSSSNLADNIIDPSADRQSQETSGSLVQSFMKETTEKTDALNEPSTSITTGFDTNPTAECQSQESSGSSVQSFEQTRKETSTLDKTVMVPRKNRSKLWNYFEELKPTLVKCTTCKNEIKISHPKNYITRMRIHLTRHGIFLDNDIHTLPDDLRQYYSELPGYKAKCKDCGKTLSFLTCMKNLIKHLRRHSTIRIQSRDKTIIMAPKRKGSNFWNYFEKLKPTLIKCTTCKKEIKLSHPSIYTKLPGYKAKCNNCGETYSFLSDFRTLRIHLRRHSTRILSRDETVIMAPKRKRSKFWNYFENLKPSLVKCTTCKKEIKVHPTNCITIMRAHLLKKHGMSFDDDTLTLPDDLKQNYSELPGYKAKCNNCGKAISFLTNTVHLRRHLRRHSTSIQGRNEPSTSSLADDIMDPSAHRQNQETSGLLVQSFMKETTEKTDALNEPSTLSSTAYIMDPSTGKYIPLRQSQEQVPSGLHVQSFKETAENTGVLDEPSTSSSADYVMDPSAEHQSGEPCGFPVQSFEQMTEGTSALHSDWFYYTIPSDSSSTYYVMAPSAEHQSGEQPG
ncbi:uncharacterized protein [Temnothorax longispinosus]|uniref:uncharacterized protein isoform X3 n=1 Tax=Temnothorax longispinosus TaxID=300112 RepID=UPI003A9A49EF